MKKRTLKSPLIILLMIPICTLTAQEIGIQMGSMRKMYADGMPAVIAKLKELGITELEGGGGALHLRRERPRRHTNDRR
jgi:hypothetical protein